MRCNNSQCIIFFDKSVMYLNTISEVESSKLPVGSSPNNTDGFLIIALATATLRSASR